MNKQIIYSFIVGCGIVAATSCSIDETNYSSLDQEIVYPTEAGFNGLVKISTISTERWTASTSWRWVPTFG